MKGITTEAKLGLFVLIAIIMLAYLTFQVSEFRLIKEKGYEIDVLFDSVGGLDLKSPVRIAGVEVGKVAKIELENGKAKVTLRIFPDINIPKGAKAVIKSTGLMGEKYVEVVPGEERETLKEHERIAQGAPPADIDKLVNQLSSIADDIRGITGALRNVLGTQESQDALKEMVQNIRELSKNLNNIVSINKDAFSSTMKNFEEFSAMLKSDTPQLIAKLNSIADKIEKGEGTMGKLIADEELYKNLNSTIEKLSKIAEKVEKGEGTIGKLVTDDKVYENLNETLIGIKDYVAKADLFKTTVGFRSEYLFEDVTAKVDGTATIRLVRRHGHFADIEFAAPAELLIQMVVKGSVAVDGISLTISAMSEDSFSVAVIPETLDRTTLGKAGIGDCVNVETDIIVKVVSKQLANILPRQRPLTMERLKELGF